MQKGKRKVDIINLIKHSDSDDEGSPPRKLAKATHRSSAPNYITSSSPNQALGSSQTRYTNAGSSNGAYTNIPRGSQYDPDNRETWSSSQQDRWFDEDMRREINVTQDPDDEDAYEGRQLYGILNTKIVGVRYYNGRATIDEYVVIRREPSNPYDKNAIRIDNVIRQQIGHIGRQVAAKLQPFIDSKELIMEGALTGTKGPYDCPIALKLFGTSDPVRAQELRQKMEAVKLPVNELDRAERERQKRKREFEKQQKARQKAARSIAQNGGVVIDEAGPNRYAQLNTDGERMGDSVLRLCEVLSSTAIHNPREIQDAVNRFGFGEEVLSQMSMADQPKEMATTLLAYQRQGLRWMLEHESPRILDNGEVTQFWKKAGGAYTNIATSFTVTKAPELASGGILADDMGLGKTIQIISLIMTDPKKDGQPTLIVAPLSVMSNWKNQAALHVKTKYTPRVLVYHGQENRGLSAAQLREYDIIITTYQTMTLELFTGGRRDQPATTPTSKGLFSLRWRRVVLDEGHQIRNPRTKMSRAAYQLDADSRWILSGTPIVNNLKDLYSHVKFLRLSGGLSEFEIFNGTVIRPVKNRDPAAQLLLRALMQTLCLRRMKDMKFVDLKLPPLTFHKSVVQFLPHEQERYNAFKAEATGLVEAAKAKKGENTMTHLLEVLLRLRQTCNHWRMCGEERVSKLLSLIEENKIIHMMKPENVQALQDLLQLKLDSQEECPICMEVLSTTQTQAVVTPCAHVFCHDCITQAIDSQHRCPLCRADISSASVLISPAPDPESPPPLQVDPAAPSSKTLAILSHLVTTARTSPPLKTVIFSQWTSYLDILEPSLAQAGIGYTRLDGRLTPLARDTAIDTLATNSKCTVLLASLSACSVGVTLTAASQVILADSWWAPAIEDQAVDRVYRLGQTVPCRVVRFVMAGSVEEEVLGVQEEKRRLVGVAFGLGSRGERRGDRLGEIERLLR